MIDKNLLKELQPYKQKVSAVIFLDIVLAITIIARCYCLASIIDTMLFSNLSLKAAVPRLALLLLLFLLEAGINLIVRLLTHKVSVDIRRKIRYAFIHKLIVSSPLSEIYDTSLLQIVTKNVDSFDAYFSKFLPQLLITVLIPLFLIPTAFYNDWISGLIFLCTLPLIPFFMILIGQRAQAENRRQWSALSHLSALFTDLLSGIAVIKIYNQTKNQLQKIISAGEQFSQAVLKTLRIAFLSAFFLELIATLSIAVLAVNIGLRLLYGQADFLPVFFILLLAPEFYKPLRQTGSMFHDAMGALTNTAKIYSLINKPPAGNTALSAVHLQQAPQISFEAVDFQYSDNRETALTELNMSFAAGKISALTGRSGAGKSTIFSLLLGFINPDKGRILINGIDLNSFDKKSWRQNIAYVPQQAHIFNTTVRENICLGRNINDHILQKVLDKAGLTETILSLPQKLDTVIGAGGHGLSCGQIRRIALARVFLSKASILLLDEPMEGLDTVTENIVQQGINELAQNKTVIIIAHRLATIKKADRIFVLSQGKLIEQGSEFDLCQNKGLYYKMHQASIGGA